MDQITICIIDDHKIVRQGMKELLVKLPLIRKEVFGEEVTG